MGKDGPRGPCRKKALKCQLFIVGYLQFVETEHMQAALCSTGYGVARELHRQVVRQWYRNIPKGMVQWGHLEAPKEMAVIYNLGEENIEPEVA